jgi:hypothetical protein
MPLDVHGDLSWISAISIFNIIIADKSLSRQDSSPLAHEAYPSNTLFNGTGASTGSFQVAPLHRPQRDLPRALMLTGQRGVGKATFLS